MGGGEDSEVEQSRERDTFRLHSPHTSRSRLLDRGASQQHWPGVWHVNCHCPLSTLLQSRSFRSNLGGLPICRGSSHRHEHTLTGSLLHSPLTPAALSSTHSSCFAMPPARPAVKPKAKGGRDESAVVTVLKCDMEDDVRAAQLHCNYHSLTHSLTLQSHSPLLCMVDVWCWADAT